MQACDKCGVDLRYPTAAHIIDCSTVFEQRHGRPKPPRARTVEHSLYQLNEGLGVVAVYRGNRGLSSSWFVEWTTSSATVRKYFPTHAEAIAWAMKEVG